MAMAKPWNPMADAYKNKDFNKYETGPGCELDDNAQPGAIAANGHRNNGVKYKLCFKNVPSEMTDKALENLCSHYGKVIGIHRAQKVNLIFISFASLGDMERVLTALKDYPQHGIQVSVARESEHLVSNNNTKDGNIGNSLNNSSDQDSSSNNQINMARRSIKGPFTNPQRPGPMPRKPLVTEIDYETSKLKDVDPQKHFLIQNDMHDNDRNHHNTRSNSQGKGKKNVHTGRGYHVEPKETTEKLQQLSQSSQGSYNSEKNEYVKNGQNVNPDEKILGDCTLCNKPSTNVCQRCGDFYCSVECQKRDWQRHRYICFQMPSLIKPTSYNCNSNSDVPSEASSLVSLQKAPAASSTPQITQKKESNVNNTQKRGSDKYNDNKMQDQKPFASQSQGKNATNQNVQQKPNMQSNNYQNVQNVQQKQDLKGDSIQNKSENKTNISTNQKQVISGDKQIEKRESKNETVAKVEAPAKQQMVVEKSQVPSSGSLVAVTSTNTTNLFYIRSLAPEDNIEYIKGLNIVINESKKSKFIDKMPERGDLLVADFQETGYYRVLVINPQSVDEILVAYLDFGNVEKKKLSELKELPPAAYNLKRYAIPVRLKDVPMEKPNDATQEYLNSFVDSNKELKIIYEGNSDNVEAELIDISNNENVNKTILKLMDIDVPTDKDPPVFLKDIPIKLLPAGEKVPVFVFDNSLIQTGVISCIHENDVIPLEGFNNQLQEYAKKDDQPYTPREGELCLVKYEDDGIWYRAECLEVVGDQNPSVIFIDYGNLTTANIKDIRKYPKEFTHPCTTSLCLIDGLPETMEVAVANRLKELIPMNDRRVLDKVIVQKDEQGEETNIVFLPNVISTLKAEKLI